MPYLLTSIKNMKPRQSHSLSVTAMNSTILLQRGDTPLADRSSPAASVPKKLGTREGWRQEVPLSLGVNVPKKQAIKAALPGQGMIKSARIDAAMVLSCFLFD